MNIMKNKQGIICIAVICLAMVLSASLLGRNIRTGLLSGSRVISSRGAAEQSVKALNASVSVEICIRDYNIEDAKNKFNAEFENIYNCVNDLVNADFAGCRVENADMVLNDSRSEYDIEWVDDKQVKVQAKRYSVSNAVKIHAAEVENAQKLRDDIEAKLIVDALSTYATVTSVHFVYPDVANIKPELLEKSYIEARKAAEQFAKNSGQTLGKLKTADQGFVELTPKGYLQTARIVTNATFYID